jgi:hypothetical protein
VLQDRILQEITIQQQVQVQQASSVNHNKDAAPTKSDLLPPQQQQQHHHHPDTDTMYVPGT